MKLPSGLVGWQSTLGTDGVWRQLTSQRAVDSESCGVDAEEKPMRSLHWGQRLAVAVPLSLLLVLVGVVGLRLAVRSGDVVPPALDVGGAHIRIAAYRTYDPECLPYTYCPLESGVLPRAYYVVWRVDELATAAQGYGRTAHRLLVVPLQR